MAACSRPLQQRSFRLLLQIVRTIGRVWKVPGNTPHGFAKLSFFQNQLVLLFSVLLCFPLLASGVTSTKFVISIPSTDVTIDSALIVTVQATDNSGTVNTAENRDVTLLASGSASGAGVVDVVGGSGTVLIRDRTVETVTLSLSDSATTGLDVTATATANFRSVSFVGYANAVAGGCSSTNTLVNNACSGAFSGSRAADIQEVMAQTIKSMPTQNFAGGFVLFKCDTASDCITLGNKKRCTSMFSTYPTTLAAFQSCCTWGEKVMCVLDHLVSGALTIVVGSGTAALLDGTGTSANSDTPTGITSARFSDMVFFSDRHAIRQFSTQDFVVSTIAGLHTAGSNDATGASASFNSPRGVVLSQDETILYVADSGNHKIRRIVISSGVVTTLAGDGTNGFVDATGSAAKFDTPSDLAMMHSGDLIVVDKTNNRLRRLVSDSGVVTTIAGSGAAASTDGTGVAAAFNGPQCVAITKSDIAYVGEQGACLIRRIDLSTNVVTTIVGNTLQCTSTDGTSSTARLQVVASLTLSVDEGLLYFTEGTGNTVRAVDLGDMAVYTLVLSSVGLSAPSGLAATRFGTTLIVSDGGNHRLRQLVVSAVAFPPLSITYSGFPATLTKGVTMSAQYPAVLGGAISSWSTSLPVGLSIASGSGAISGAPTTSQTSTSYTVTGTNSAGSAAASLTFAISGPSSQTFVIGLATSSTLTVTGTVLSTANRLKIIGLMGVCGSASTDTAVTSPPGSPTLSSGELLFASVSVNTLGSYRVCWWDGVGSDTDTAYVTEVGLLGVQGPTLSQAFSGFVNTATSLTVFGSNLQTGNRISIIAISGACGTTIESNVIVPVSPGTPSGSSSALTFAGVEVATVDQFKVCWWSGVGVDEVASYSVELGILTTYGPTPSQTFTLTVSTAAAIQMQGSGMIVSNKIIVISSAGTCGATSQSGALSSTGTPSAKSNSLIYPTMLLTAVGTYKVCWWVGTIGSDLFSYYKTEVGTLTVYGPTSSQTFSGAVNAGLSLTIAGTQLNSVNRLRIIDGGNTCGVSAASSHTVTAPSAPSSSSATSLTYTGVKLQSLGTFKVCWWSGSGTENNAAYATTVGQLTIYGPSAGHQFECMINTLCTVVVTGSAQAANNRVMIIDSSGTCGSSSSAGNVKSAGLPGGSATHMTYSGIEVTALGDFRVCWWDGSGGSSQVSLFATTIGHLAVSGPASLHAFSVVINVATALTLAGSSLADTNRLLIIPSSGACGFASSPFPALNASSGNFTENATVFVVPKLDALGHYKLCWWEGSVGLDIDQSYKTLVGTIAVMGPVLKLSLNALINTAFSVTLVGSGMSTASRLKIIVAEGVCGQTAASSSVSTAPGTPSGSPFSMTHTPVVVADLGSYKLCWCHEECSAVSSFDTQVGDLLVEGPTTQQKFNAGIGEASFLTIVGSGLSVSSRIKMVVLGGCGTANTATSVLSTPTAPITYSATKLVFANAAVSSSVSLDVCWWSGTSGSDAASSYDTLVGTLTARGPSSSQTWSLIVNRPNGSMSVEGEALTTANRIKIIYGSSYCGSSDTDPAVTSAPAVPSGSLSEMHYPDILVSEVGSFKVCWWSGVGIDSASQYVTDIGSLVVGGPTPDQEFTLKQGLSGSLVVQGTMLSTDNRLLLVESEYNCAVAVSSASVVDLAPGIPSILVNSTEETFAEVRVTNSSQLRVCWCDGMTSCTSSGDFATFVGVLSVGSTLASQFMIVATSEGLTDYPIKVTVEAHDISGQVVTSEHRDVTLVATGAPVVGASRVTMSYGRGYIFLRNPTEATAALSLSDTQLTQLGVSSTASVVVRTKRLRGYAPGFQPGGACLTTDGDILTKCRANFPFSRGALYSEVYGGEISGLGTRNTAGGNVLFSCASEPGCITAPSLRKCVKDGELWPTTTAMWRFVDCCNWGDYAICVEDGATGQISMVLESDNATVTQPTATVGSWDSALLFISDQHSIRKMTVASSSIVLLAGGTAPGFANGLNASFDSPSGLALSQDGFYLYVADTGNHRIRVVSVSAGSVATLSGSGLPGFQEGYASGSAFNSPKGLATDGVTNLYVADSLNHRIRIVALADGAVTTLAGSGVAGTLSTAGTTAQFDTPAAVALDAAASNLYVGGASCVVQRIIIKYAAVSTLMGVAGDCNSVDGVSGSVRFNTIGGLALDVSEKYLYIGESTGGNVRFVGFDTNQASTMGLLASAAGTFDLFTSRDGQRIYGCSADGIREVRLSKQPLAPETLSYDIAFGQVLSRGVPVSYFPVFTGGSPSSYTVSPTFPGGLALDALTGRVAGIPTTAVPMMTYNVTASNTAGSFSTIIVIAVTGPNAAQSFACLKSVACSLTIEGFLMFTNSRIILIDSAGTCGTTPQDNGVVTTSAGTPAGGTSSLTFTGIVIASSGALKVCWWSGSGSSGPSAYTVYAGLLEVMGADSVTSSAIINEATALVISGSYLSTSNRIHLVGSSGVCGSSSPDGNVLGPIPNAPNGTASAMTFSGVSVSVLGSYKVCFWTGIGNDVTSSYQHFVGSVAVGGPTASAHAIALPNTALTWSLSGTGLASTNRIMIIPSPQACGSSGTISLAPSSSSSTSQIYSAIVLSISGSYSVCWWHGTGVGSFTNYQTKVGTISVLGPQTQNFYAVHDTPFDLIVVGTSLSTANRLAILPMSVACGSQLADPAVVVSPPGVPSGGDTSLTFKNVQIRSFIDMRVCWWGGIGMSSAAAYATDLGPITMVAPALLRRSSLRLTRLEHSRSWGPHCRQQID
jgi:hypothetical protein